MFVARISIPVVTMLAITAGMAVAQPVAPAPSAPIEVPVRIEHPLPLPITGTVTAVEGGLWNVGIERPLPLPITGSVAVNGPVTLATTSPLLCEPTPPETPYLYSVPRNGPFSFPAVIYGPATNTRLAITSVTFANQFPNASNGELYVDDCAGHGHITKFFAYLPPTGTFTASFPTPLVVDVIGPGITWCLNLHMENGALNLATIVGYYIH